MDLGRDTDFACSIACLYASASPSISCLGPLLGDGDQDAVGQVGIPAAQVDAAVVAESADFGEHVASGLAGRGRRTP